MTRESIAAIADAIRAHLETTNPGDVLTDFFVAYGSMKHQPDAPDGISYGMHYTTSDASPQGALGIAHIGIANLADDLLQPHDVDHDDGSEA